MIKNFVICCKNNIFLYPSILILTFIDYDSSYLIKRQYLSLSFKLNLNFQVVIFLIGCPIIVLLGFFLFVIKCFYNVLRDVSVKKAVAAVYQNGTNPNKVIFKHRQFHIFLRFRNRNRSPVSESVWTKTETILTIF